VSGETGHHSIIAADPESVVARAVTALARFPAEHSWVLIGGIAVFIRLGSVTRPTADADTIAKSQAALLERLRADEIPSIIAGGELQIEVGNGTVDIDVMDLADEPLPIDAERRAFALARRAALNSAKPQLVTVATSTGEAVAEASIPIASVAALIALKTVSMVRRPHGNSPQKVGSDIHDLVRLVATGAQAAAEQLVELDADLSSWVAAEISRAFDTDLRYTLLRFHRTDRSAGAQALSDADVAATVTLADAIRDLR